MNNTSIFNKLPSLSLSDNVLLLTHTDMDGSGPAVLLSMILKNLTVVHCPNSSMSETIKNNIINNDYADRYNKIIVCDISCSAEDAEIIDTNKNSEKLILLDHHKTAMSLNKYNWAVIEPDYVQGSTRYTNNNIIAMTHSSGTSLIFDYLCCKTDEYGRCLIKNLSDKIQPIVKDFVNIVTEYDTWDWVNVFNKKPDCETLSTLFSIYRSEIFEQIMIDHLNSGMIISDQDRMLLRIEASKIDEHLKCIQRYLKPATLSLTTNNETITYSMIYCICNKYMPQTFDLMKTSYPDTDIYVINYGLGVSVRTTKSDIDVSQIVSMFGGGGHIGAGGFPIPAEKQKAYLASAFSTNSISAHIEDMSV